MMDNPTVTIEVDSTVRACVRHLRDGFPDLYSELEAKIGEAQRLLYQAEQKLEGARYRAEIIQGAEKLCALTEYGMIPLKSEVPAMLDKVLKDLLILTKSISCKVR